MLCCSVCSCEFGLRMAQKRKVYKRKRKHKRKKFWNHQQRRVFVMTAARKCQKQRLKKARVRMRPFSKKCHLTRLRPRYGRFMSKKRQPVNDVPCQFSHTGPICNAHNVAHRIICPGLSRQTLMATSTRPPCPTLSASRSAGGPPWTPSRTPRAEAPLAHQP